MGWCGSLCRLWQCSPGQCHRKVGAPEHDQGYEIVDVPEPAGHLPRHLDPVVERLDARAAGPELDRPDYFAPPRTHAPLGRDHLRYPAPLRPGQPFAQALLRRLGVQGLGDVVEPLLEVVCASQLWALPLYGCRRPLLPLGQALGVLERRVPAAFDGARPRSGRQLGAPLALPGLPGPCSAPWPAASSPVFNSL